MSIQDPSAGKCPASAKIYQVGNPAAPDTMASPPKAGDRLIDGDHGASIKCSVKGSGPYQFSGTIQGISSEGDKVTLTLTDGVVNADKATGNTTVYVNTPQLSGNFGSAPNACTLTVVDGNVKGGSLWAKVACATITLPSTGQSCAVGTSTNFVLENCDGS